MSDTPAESIESPQETPDQISKLADQLARLTADHQNYVRRAEQEKGEMGNFFTEKFAKKILPTIDNLERVLTGTPKE
jgi:molecular chaperone GrpE (heat shock protein)